MSDSQQNNKRIAKNTLFLYLRQFITMAVSLYTVRVVLDVLGVEDYGIYNVVGGIVSMFNFISGTLGSATQRYLSFEMGKKDNSSVNKVFSLSMKSYFYLIVLILILAETLGLWFLNTQMTIPSTRIVAANWVYQSSILSFCVTILCTPYNASIIAREKMDVFAMSSVVEAGLKLAIVLLLPCIMYDHLIVYAILMIAVTSGIQMFYMIYCIRNFQFCRYHNYHDNALLKELMGFAGWNSIGSLANVLRSQGLNILLNLFFNPAINAARGIAYQVNAALSSFYNNFYTAVRPQMTKYYASGEKQRTIDLALNSTRYAYFLMLIIVLPIYCEADRIMSIWLKEVPPFTVLFLRITLIQSVIEVVAMPMTFMLQAAGQIKYVQLTVSILYLMNIPISYVLLRMGYPASTVFYVNLLLVVISFIPRLILSKRIIGLPYSYYTKVVFRNIIPVTALLVLWGVLFMDIISNGLNLIISLIFHVAIAVLAIAIMGVKKNESSLVIKYIRKKCHV